METDPRQCVEEALVAGSAGQEERVPALLREAGRHIDHLMSALAFAECRTEPRDYVTAHAAKTYVAKRWGFQVAERLFPGRQYGEPPGKPM